MVNIRSHIASCWSGILTCLFLLLSCEPNFKPEDSKYGPLTVITDFKGLFPFDRPAEGYISRVTLTCYGLDYRHVEGQSTCYPDNPQESFSLSIPILERGKNYQVTLMAEYVRKTGDNYYKPLWFHLSDDSPENFILELNNPQPSCYDAVLSFETILSPDDEPYRVSLSYLGKMGRVVILNEEKAENVRWGYDTVVRFAPYDNDIPNRVATRTSEETDGFFFHVPGQSAYLRFYLWGSLAGDISTSFPIPTAKQFTIIADAATGAISMDTSFLP